MLVDILVDGRKVGTATVSVDIPPAALKHGVNKTMVLDALAGKAVHHYCMGHVHVKPSPGCALA